MTSDSQLRAMIQLLDYDNQEVLNIVEQKVLELGETFVSDLEQIWLNNDYPLLNQKIETVLKNIQQNLLRSEVNDWILTENTSPLSAWILASKIQYPGLKYENVKAQLNQIKIDAWVMLSSVQNPYDQIGILNYILFEKYGFRGNNENYHSPENSILPRVLETKKGNPISLAILYLTIAQDLGIPIFGVNLPQHFVLAYCTLKSTPNEFGVVAKNKLLISDIDSVDFYVNPFSNGQIFNKESIDAFLKVIRVEPQNNFYFPCSTMDIFKRILRNLHFAYSEQHEFDKQNDVLDLMKLIGLQMNTDEMNDEEE